MQTGKSVCVCETKILKLEGNEMYYWIINRLDQSKIHIFDLVFPSKPWAPNVQLVMVG